MQRLEKNMSLVAENISKFKNILTQCDEPNIDIGNHCNNPYGCEFKEYCIKKFTKSGKDGKLLWSITSNTLTISGDGVMLNNKTRGDFYVSRLPTPWESYKNFISSVVIEKGVTSIGFGAFYECQNLMYASIPNTVTSIGDFAFYGCNGLSSVIIPELVTSIGNSSFRGCRGLMSVNIPSSVTSIGDYAFSRCNSLTSIHVNENNTAYCSKNGILFNKTKTIILQYPAGKIEMDYNIPNSVVSIGNGAFGGCKELISVAIPNSVTDIGERAFGGCEKLTSVTIPNSVTTIKDRCFLECHGLTSVIIPNSVTSIEDYAFFHCCGLLSVIIPGSVESIGYQSFGHRMNTKRAGLTEIINRATTPQKINSYAFTACDLKNYDEHIEKCKLYVPAEALTAYCVAEWWKEYKNIEAIEGNKISGMIGNLSWNIVNGTLTIRGIGTMPNHRWSEYNDFFNSVVIENGITSLGNWSFSGCTGLTSVTISDTVTKIADNSFYGCSGLTSIIIPNSITYIGSCAFSKCSGLTSITIPKSVILIGDNAFEYCSKLASIYVDDNNPTYISENGILFNKTKNRLIRYPSGKTDMIYSIPNLVTNIEKWAFEGCRNLKSITIPNTIDEIELGTFARSGLSSIKIPNSVTSIGNRAFIGCADLTFVSIPDSVKTIGIETFSECGGITSVAIPNSVACIEKGTFNQCRNLISVTIPNSVTHIGHWAFSGCSSLTYITIPNSVTSFGTSVFGDCKFLIEIFNYATTPQTIDENVNVFYSIDKSNCILRVPAESVNEYQNAEGWKDFLNIEEINNTEEGMVTEGDYGDITWNISESTFTISGFGTMPNYDVEFGIIPFSRTPWASIRNSFTSVIIKNGITSIGNGAFSDCQGLTSAIIPNSVTYIGECAFYGCSSLTSVTIPNSVTSIGFWAFKDCCGLTSVTIPNSLKGIGFSGCFRLKSIHVENNHPTYFSENGILFNKSKSKIVHYPAGKTDENYTIPNSVTTIGGEAFSDCSALKSVTIPNSVTAIEDYAFCRCEGLKKIIIPYSVTSIGNLSFEDCISLT